MNVNTATIKDWKKIRLIDICDFIRGTEPGSDSYNKSNGIKFFRVSDISSGMRETIYTNASPDKLLLVKPEDVLISMDGSPGVVAKGLAGAISSGIRKIKLKNKNFDLTYIYFLLQTKQIQDIIKLYSTGVTILHASKSIPNLYANIPPLPEQQTIAAILSKIQEAIENQDKIIKTTTELKKSLMKKIFSEGLNGEPLKQTEIGKIPKSWEVVRLKEVCDLQNGFSFKSTDYIKHSNTINIRMSNIRPDAGFDPNYHPKYLPDEYVNKYKNFLLEDGDLIIAMTDMAGTPKILGIPTLVKKPEGVNMLLNQRVGKLFGFDSRRVDREFLRHYLSLNIVKDYYRSLSKRGVQINLGKSDILSVLVPILPLNEQKEIVKMLLVVNAKIENAKKIKSAKEDLFKSMLNNLMSGKIRVHPVR